MLSAIGTVLQPSSQDVVDAVACATDIVRKSETRHQVAKTHLLFGQEVAEKKELLPRQSIASGFEIRVFSFFSCLKSNFCSRLQRKLTFTLNNPKQQQNAQ
jgi:hypothetical protein